MSQEVAWGWGEPAEGAAITMSSALGLAAMQALRAPTAGVEGVGRDGLVAGIQGALRRMERGVMAPIEAGVDELLEQIEALAPVLEQVDAESRLQALAQHHRHPLWKKLLAFLDGVLSGLSAQLQQALLHHLIEQARDQQAQLEGQTLASFLRGITER